MDQATQVVSQPSPNRPSSSESPSKSPLKPIIITVLLGLLIGGGYFAYSFLLQPPTTQKPTQTAPKTRTDGSKTPSSHYVGSQTITLRDVTGGTSSATVIRSIIPGSIFRAVYATLPEPPEGQFYQAWAVRTDNNLSSIGILNRDFEGTYSVITNINFDSSTTYTFDDFFNSIIVTLESVEDDTMETKILEGTFTQ